jgi:hypothetical protein
MKKTIIFLVFAMLFYGSYSQETAKNTKLQSYFINAKVIDIKFHVDSKDIVNYDLTNIMSITNVKKSADGKGYDVCASTSLAELTEFIKRNIPFELVDKTGDAKAYTMATTVAQMASWNRYPTYSVYEQMMANFATTYPALCDVDTILATTPNGHKLLVLKISDNVNVAEDEPQILFSSTIHGNEGTGFVLMLRLADYLLSNYATSPQIANLVNQIELWIAPLANPDGCYNSNNNTISQTASVRYNANGSDLNRDYPRPDNNLNTDSSTWEPETKAFIKFAKKHHFNLGVNFHDGYEVVNFPWDTWTSAENTSADDAWWRRVSRRYADSTQLYAGTTLGTGYFTYEDDGITEGADWYYAYGSRQDYMNFFQYCREVTIELSLTQPASTTDLPAFWNAHYRSFLNYIRESLYGIRGIVTDACSGQPVKTKVWVNSYDQTNDSSQVYSQLPLGNYFKYINQGTYQVTFSAPGYQSKTVSNVSVSNYAATVLNVQLTPNTAPDAQFGYAINGFTVNFSNNSTNATSYLWKFGDGGTSTLANPSHTYASLGSQVVTLKAFKQNCLDSIVSSLLLTSVNESGALFLSQFTIPNPVKDQLIIRVNNPLQHPVVIRLVSIDGSIVYEGKLNGQDFSYDVNKYSGGIYLLRLESETQSGVMKLIKL